MQHALTKLAALTLAMLMLLATTGVASADHKCTAGKLKGAGKKAFAKLKCHSKAASDGATVDPECITKAETKFNDAFAKAESKPPCFATGDAAAIEAKVDAFVDDVLMELRPVATESTCAQKKLKAAGKKTFKKLNCHKKAVSKGISVDPLCLGPIEVKFAEAFVKAEEGDDCLTLADAAAIEAKVDAFIDDAVMELRPVDATECSPRKVRETGDKAQEKLRCHGVALHSGNPVEASCLTQAETRFSDGFAAAETFGDCFTSGDEAVIEAKVDAFVDDVVLELAPSGGPNECAADKFLATGRKTEHKLRCYYHAFDFGQPLNPECLTDAEIRFSQEFAKAEIKGNCLTTGDEAAIEAKVDAFVTDAVTELLP